MPPSSRDPSSRSPQSSWRAAMRDASPYLGLGMQLALTMGFFTGIGYACDQWLELTPWLTVAGAFVGMFAVFAQLIRVSNELNRKSKSKARRPPPADQG